MRRWMRTRSGGVLMMNKSLVKEYGVLDLGKILIF